MADAIKANRTDLIKIMGSTAAGGIPNKK